MVTSSYHDVTEPSETFVIKYTFPTDEHKHMDAQHKDRMTDNLK